MSLDARKRMSIPLDVIFPKRRVALTPHISRCLKRRPLSVIDVGGAMGPDARWRPLSAEYMHFMTFEPDARSTEQLGRTSNANDLIMQVALAGSPGERTLFLTEGPFASSMYQTNDALLQDFAVWPWYTPAGEATILVDTLDACLARQPNFRADFVKIDVEGADLEVLKGGRRAIETAFGVQIEVPFSVRNLGAPLQPTIDLWLREAGFSLHLMEREHWLRANGVHGALSQPQLIWADAVYFRGREWVLHNLAAAGSAAQAEERLAAILAILLIYNAHDYAAEIVAAAKDHGAVNPSSAADFASSVEASLTSLPLFAARGACALIIATIAAVPLALLGSRGRRLAGQVIAAQAAPLFGSLARAARRGGVNGGCLPDV